MRQCSQFCLSLSKIQHDFSQTEYRKVAGRTVVTVYLTARSCRVLHIFYRLVSCYTNRQIGSQDVCLPDTVIPRSTDALCQTRVAVFHFFGKRHGFPSFTVGKTCSVFHQIRIDKLTGQARTSLGGHQRMCRRIVVNAHAVIELDGKDVFIGIGIGRIQMIFTAINQFFCRIRCLLQIIRIIIPLQSQIMIFPVCTFVQTEARLQRQCRPTVYAERTAGLFFLCRQVLDSIVDIGKHIGHHQFTRIACLIQVRVIRKQFLVIPRHITETLYLIIIEVGTEETCQRRIFHSRFRIFTFVYIAQQGIDTTQRRPAPSSPAGRNDAVFSAQHLVRKFLLYIHIALLVIR